MGLNGQCHICIRECSLGNSFCHRRDENGELLQSDRFCAISVDNLFDKPIIYFSKNSKILSIGSWGCNFRCLGCQNVNLSWNRTGDGLGSREMQPEDVIELALCNGCTGICYTFNEPVIISETVERIAEHAKGKGLDNFLVTNSTLTEKSTRQIARYIDAVAVDIKSMSDSFYYQYCGAEGIPDIVSKILTCIHTFADSGCHVETRTNIISGGNDQDENYRQTASWIRKNLGEASPWHITRFFPAHLLKQVPKSPTKSMLRAQQIGYEEGLKYVHTYFSKGCDCARENNLVDQASTNDGEKHHSCCC